MSVKTPSEHENLFHSSYKRFSIILEELTNSYPLYKLNPTYSKFSNEYKKQCTQLKTVKDAIFLYKNNLQKDSVTLKNSVENINAKITSLNDENKNLTDKLNNLQHSDYAAGGELIDKKFLYNELFTENVILSMIVTCITGYLIKKYSK